MSKALIDHAPRVWVMMGHKAGDNSQVLALAEGLGLPFEIKRSVYRPYELITNLLLGATLAGVNKSKSSRLEPPWPDLVISAGRRNEPICRWIQKQAKDKHVRLVHVGRPWANLDRFDLVVTTPQYRLPRRDNVLHNQTPLHRVTAERLAEESQRWAPRLEHLPKPYVAVMIGGSSGPYSFDHRAAARLARQASALATSLGGSLLISTSARTPADTIETLSEHLSAPAFLYRWSREATDNPYFAFLGLAEAIVVTGDSMSMLTEACATRKQVHIFDLGEGANSMRPHVAESTKDGTAVPRRSLFGIERAHVSAFCYRQMMRFGPKRLSRDIRIIHRDLINAGRAVWLGDSFPEGHRVPPLTCVQNAVIRVKALFADPPRQYRDLQETQAGELYLSQSA
jgi:hypothetical protein